MRLSELCKANLGWCKTTDLRLIFTDVDWRHPITYTMEQALELYGDYHVYTFLNVTVVLGTPRMGGDPA